MCYVGKATKIFFVLVGVTMVVGLVVGFGIVRHGWAHKAAAAQPCQSSPTSPGCRPIFSDPFPADTTAAPAPPIPAALPVDPFGAPPTFTVQSPSPSLPTTLPPPTFTVQPPSPSLPSTTLPPPNMLSPPPPPPPQNMQSPPTEIPTPAATTAAPPLVSPGPPSPVSEPLGPARMIQLKF